MNHLFKEVSLSWRKRLAQAGKKGVPETHTTAVLEKKKD